MQLQLNLCLSMRPIPRPFHLPTWTDCSLEGRQIGFAQKVEVSQSLLDALAPRPREDEQEYEQRLYDALWMAQHDLCLDQGLSCSFTFDFLHEDLTLGRLIEASLRLHVEVRGAAVLLGLMQDFPSHTQG